MCKDNPTIWEVLKHFRKCLASLIHNCQQKQYASNLVANLIKINIAINICILAADILTYPIS